MLPHVLARAYGVTRQYVHRIVKLAETPFWYDPCWSCGSERLGEGATFCSPACELAYEIACDEEGENPLSRAKINENRHFIQLWASLAVVLKRNKIARIVIASDISWEYS